MSIRSNSFSKLTNFLTSSKSPVALSTPKAAKTVCGNLYGLAVSSNLERLLFYATNGNAALVAEWMNQLEKEGKYTVDSDTLKFLQAYFYAGSASQTDTKNEIKQVFTESNYAIDPHTAVASFVTRKYEEI